ncbi:hypothetical protein [Streptomyces sp. NPDC088719]|uniref:hypothetical protein n=1 Tax=Streptomyces sp. NPDC088719 TaxID=3365872 RepID=UPI0038163B9E
MQRDVPPSSELRAALGEAGLRAAVTEAEVGNQVRIAPLDPADARQLARLIRTGTKRTLKAARALREICEGYRINLPGLRVRQGRITLGTVQVDDAARLARLLGAVPPAVDLSDAGTVRTVLGQAFPRATGGGILSVSAREDAPEVLELGSIDARTARRLISALRF